MPCVEIHIKFLYYAYNGKIPFKAVILGVLYDDLTKTS